MIREADAVTDRPVDVQAAASESRPSTWAYLWSVRRELWENRSIYLAPLATAGILLVGFCVGAARLPVGRRATLLLDPALQRARIERPYDFALGMIMLTTMLVWLFYCLDALYGERRDRSILFWKSLPVSDLTAVLSKATIPLAILPAVTFAVTGVTQLLILLTSTLVLRMNGLPAATVHQLPLIQLWGAMLYGLMAMTLWNAPIYGWLLLVSAWARRATLLWALVPPLSLVALEKIAFQTNYIFSFLRWRGVGWTMEAFASKPRGTLMIDPMNPIAPAKYLSSPGLWIGLLVAAAFLAATVRLRRHRAPL